MATPASVTNTFVSGTTILSAQANQNFSDLTAYLNSGVGFYQAGSITTAALGAQIVTAAAIANGTITDVQVAAANKDGATGTASLRTLGTGALQAASGADGRFISAGFSSARPVTDGSYYFDTDNLLLSRYSTSGSIRRMISDGPRHPHSDFWMPKGGIVPRLSTIGFSTTGWLSGETAVTTGTLNGVAGDIATDITSAASTNSVASVGTSALLKPSNQPSLSAVVASGAVISNTRLWVGPHSTSALLGFDTMSAAGLEGYNFRYSTSAGDTTWKLITYDGITPVVIDTTIAFTASHRYVLFAWFDSSGGLNWRVQDLSGSTASGRVTTNLSSSISNNGALLAGLRTLNNAAKSFTVYSLGFACQIGSGIPSFFVGDLPSANA